MKYRIREYGPVTGRFFQAEEQTGVEKSGSNWHPIPWAPDFTDLLNAKNWLNNHSKPNPPDIIHPYP